MMTRNFRESAKMVMLRLQKNGYALTLSLSSSASASRLSSSTKRQPKAQSTLEVRRGRNVVDVARMVQINKKTGVERPVQRKTGQPARTPAMTAAAFQKTMGTLQVQKDIRGIVKGMETYPDHPGVQEAGCKALITLASINDQSKVKIAAANGIEGLLAAMRAHPEHAAIQEAACRALRRLAHSASLSAMQCQARIVGLGGLDAVVGALRRLSGHVGVQYEGLAVLRILSTEAPGHRVQIVGAGAVDAALAAMSAMPTEQNVQGQGCGVLRFLAAGGAGVDVEKVQALRVEIAGKGGVELVKAARAGAVMDDTKKWARQVLDFLSSAAAEAAAARRREEEKLAGARREAEDGDCRALCALLRARQDTQDSATAATAGGGREGIGGGEGASGVGEASKEGGSSEAESKYTARKLILKASTVAAAGLRPAIGLEDDRVLGNLMQDPEAAIELEFLEHGTPEDRDNFNYIFRGRAGAWDDIPSHVKHDIEVGRYHGGELGPDDYDAGHEGMSLDDFVAHPHCRLAKLRRHHVLVLRLYTSSSFSRFNKPLRGVADLADGAPRRHPFRFSVYVLAEALKMLRVVGAEMDPEGFNQVRWLFRGMADMEVDVAGRFLAEGGTELALMSTTDKQEVALSYAASRRPLVFKYKTLGLTRGCSIQFLSLYPKEDEFLYPPLTFISAESDLYEEDGITFLDVVPQMS